MNKSWHRYLLSPQFMLCLLVLILNDWYLKEEFPGFITGKLSDFAGLFVLSIFLSTILGLKNKLLFYSIGALFIFWKLPVSDTFITNWNRSMPYSIDRVVDYTDYLALVSLVFAYYFEPDQIVIKNTFYKKMAVSILVPSTVIAIMATSGMSGNIKRYPLHCDKNTLNLAMDSFYIQNPNLKVPDNYKYMVIQHIGVRKEDRWMDELNADSINFDFYFRSENIILWSGITGAQDDWYSSPSEICLIGLVNVNDGLWEFNAELSKEKKEKLKLLFEDSVISKLKPIIQSRK